MNSSKYWWDAMSAVADMEPDDPGNKVADEITRLQKLAPESEAEIFGDAWSAYESNK